MDDVAIKDCFPNINKILIFLTDSAQLSDNDYDIVTAKLLYPQAFVLIDTTIIYILYIF